MRTVSLRNVVSSLAIIAVVLLTGASFTNKASAQEVAPILGVTNIVAQNTYATAGGDFGSGWKWVFNVTVPANETILQFKLGDWIGASGGSFSTAGNVRIYSAQSLNAPTSDSAIVLNAGSAYGDGLNLNENSDLDSSASGRQIQVVVEVKVPADANGGSYSTSYGIKSAQDTTKPVITLNGDDPQIIEAGTAYSELGATVTDNHDVGLTATVDSSKVQTSNIGTYPVTYNTSDISGNPADQVTRDVKVVDTIKPIITAPVDVTSEAVGKTTVVALGMPTFSDSSGIDPKITNDAPQGLAFPLGETVVTWTAADAAGNIATATQNVTITDKTVPVITLNGDSSIDVPVFGSYEEKDANVSDNYDGDSKATVTGSVDTANVGTYTLTYDATDSNGNVATEVSRTVNVIARPITVTADTETKVYGTDDPALTYKITNGSLNDGDELSGSLVRASDGNSENVGTYDITQGSLSIESKNYVLTFIPSTLTITPASATVTLGNVDQTYGSVLPVTVTTVPEGHSTKVTYDRSETLPTSAGSYAVVATVTDPNYSGEADGTLKIGKAVATVSAVGEDKTYNGTKEAKADLSVSGAVSGDSLTATGEGSFADKNVGDAKDITVSNISLSGDNAGNYTFNTVAKTTGNIAQKSLTVTAIGVDKQYNHSTYADVKLSSSDIATNDDVKLSSSAYFADDSKVGQDKNVNVKVTIGGADAENYLLQSDSINTTANITPAPLTIDGVKADNRTYDAMTDATLSGTPELVGVIEVGGIKDSVTVNPSQASASFADKSAGNGKSVTVTGYIIAGDDAKNYSLTQPIGITADITPLGITEHVTADNKVYDGTTAATILTRALDGVIASDDVTYTTDGTASFADKDVGNGKEVTAIGLRLSGTDASNYTVNSTATTSADIAPKHLTVTATIGDKVYDGTNSIDDKTVTFKTDALDGDTVSVPTGFGYTLNDHNVGTQSVIVKAISISGRDAANYHLTNTSADTTVNIISRPLAISGLTAADKIYDGNTDVVISGEAKLGGVVSSDDVSLIGAPTASFSDANAGADKDVVVSGYSLSGSVIGNYSLSPLTLKATISKATPEITWATPAEISDTDALSDAQLNATASVDGTFVYTPASGTRLTSASGTLHAEFTPTDGINYNAVSKEVTISVKDTTIPVITLKGEASITAELGSTYTDAGATALDSFDGDITSKIIASSTVDATKLGSYSVTYDVSDLAGNKAEQVVRTINIVDTTKPSITAPTDITIVTTGEYTAVNLGAPTVSDNSGSTTVTNDAPAEGFKIGETIVAWTATDASGNSSMAAQKVTVAPELSSIAITMPLSKTVYNIGESLDLTGLVVTGTYSDNSTKVETVDASNITGFDTNTAGSKTLTVTIDGKTATFSVTVNSSDTGTGDNGGGSTGGDGAEADNGSSGN